MNSVRLLRVWLGIGIQSFGGGTTTLALIRRSAVVEQGWISEEEFNRDWALCQMTPGINLIALAILLGKQVAGARGVVIALSGLMLPSASLTAVLTAGFLAIRDLPSVRGALHGILPATVGLGLVTAIQMAHHPIRVAIKRGTWQVIFSCLLLLGSAGALWSGKASVISVLLAAGILGAVENVVAERFWPSRENPLE